jgi:hypothetical protein
MKRKVSAILVFTIMMTWSLALSTPARMRGALPGKPVAIEGTIKGLLSACRGVYCPPGEESITAALQHQYVLVAGEGKIYSLPNVKPDLLARYIARRVRITGNEIGGGRAILVRKAEVLTGGGHWFVFWSPGIVPGLKER